MEPMSSDTKLALLRRLFIRDNRLTTSSKGAAKVVSLSACLKGKNESANTQLELIRALAI